MNLARIAALLRELADAVEEDEKPPKKKRGPKRKARVRSYPAPLRPVSEEDLARARATLRRRGIIP